MPMTSGRSCENRGANDVRVDLIGIDGLPGCLVVAASESVFLESELCASMTSNRCFPLSRVAWWIAIDSLWSRTARVCDLEARRLLGGRGRPACFRAVPRAVGDDVPARVWLSR